MRFAAPLLVIAATALAFSNALPDRLVFDDKIYIPEVTRCTPASLLQSVPWASEGRSGPFRPVSMATICLQAQLDRPSAWRLHASNVALHLVVTFLVYLLTLGVLRDRRGEDARGTLALAAGGAALVFGVHPVHTEAVDSIFNRSEIVATLFMIAGLLWIRRFGDRKPAVAWTGAGVAYAGALLAKESGVSFPALAVLVILLRHWDEPWRALWRRIAPAATLVLPLAGYLWLRQRALATITAAFPHAAYDEGPLTPAKRVAYLVTTLGDALRLLVWPSPLRANYGVYAPHAVLLCGLALLALAGLAVAFRRRVPVLGVAIAWLVAALAVSTRLATDPSVAAAFAERYLYLPSVGPTLALAWGLAALGARAGRLAIIVPALALALGFGLLTRQRNIDWHDDVSLWEHDARVAPQNGFAWMFLTTNLIDLNEYTRAARICAERLADASPENGQFLNNCAIAADATGRPDEAERLFRRAIALGEGTNVSVNFARMLARLGRRQEAQAIFEDAIARETGEAMRHVRRGQMLATVHPEAPEAAKAEFEAALRVSPGLRLAAAWLESLARSSARRGTADRVAP